MAIAPTKEELIEHVTAALPSWFVRQERAKENIRAFAEAFLLAISQEEFWHEQSYILSATVDVADWLDQHARDRGTSRRESETDVALRARLRTPEAALIKSSIENAVQSVLDAEGLVGAKGVFELRPNSAFLTDLTAASGTGGTFVAATGDDHQFIPDTGIPNLKLFYDTVASHQLVISGAATAANDGTFPIGDIVDDAGVYVNAAGVAEVDGGVSWTINRLDAAGNVLDGFAQSYLAHEVSPNVYNGSAYRLGTFKNAIVVILPYLCTAATLESVAEALRQKVGAGVVSITECRANP